MQRKRSRNSMVTRSRAEGSESAGARRAAVITLAVVAAVETEAAASIADRKDTCLASATSQESQAVAVAVVVAARLASTADRTGICPETVINQRSPESLVVVVAAAGLASTATKKVTCLATAISQGNLVSPESHAPDLEEDPQSDLKN